VGNEEYEYHANYRQVILCDAVGVATDPAPSVTSEATSIPQ
jgi:hypothetical protein